jgi:hypothetical protein
MRYRPRTDQNQTAIVAAYRAKGLLVLSLASMGRGVPDLLVGAPPVLCLVEVKMPGGTITPDQLRFHALWPVVVVTSVEEAHAHAETLAASVSDLREARPFVSGYAEVLLQPVQRKQPLQGVLPGDGEEGRVTVGGTQETGSKGRARRENRASTAR